MSYFCPMHPEVTSGQPGQCPKCGMKLIEKTSEIRHQTSEKQDVGLSNNYTPLLIIIGLIILTSLVISFKDGQLLWQELVEYFMIGFFLVFSGFKLMDLKGFAEGYSMYDLLAKKWFSYGYIYPFLELGFGLLMILGPPVGGWRTEVLITEIIVMTFSGLGVLLKMLRHEKFQCACLGTFLKVPLTRVTLIEDFGMAILAALFLLST